MNEAFKKMPGFSRYNFFPDGKVVNAATGKVIKPFQLYSGPGVMLTRDNGKRGEVKLEAILDLFRDQPATSAEPAQAPAPTEGKATRKLSYAQAIEIRRTINTTAEKKKWAVWGRQFKIHRSNIERIMNEKAYPTKQEHIDYVQGKSDSI